MSRRPHAPHAAHATHAMALALALVSAGACAPTETGNGQDTPTTVTLALALTSAEVDDAGAPLARDADATPFAISRAALSVRRIDLWLPLGETCEQRQHSSGAGLGWLGCQAGDDRLRLDGPWIIDLVKGTWDPPLESLSVPPGTYRRISFDLAEADPADGLVAPGEVLDGRTLALEGAFATADGAKATSPFSLGLSFSEELRFEPLGGALFGIDMAKTLALSMDVGGWFAAAPLSRCAADGEFETVGGVLQIGDAGGECSEVEDAIKDAITGSGELEEQEEGADGAEEPAPSEP